MEPEWDDRVMSHLLKRVWSQKNIIVLWLFTHIIKNSSKIMPYLTEEWYVNGMVQILNSIEK